MNEYNKTTHDAPNNGAHNAQSNSVRLSQTESDRDRPSLTKSDPVRPTHWLTLEEVERQFLASGLNRSRTLLARYCRDKRLHALKDAGPNGDEWYVDPDSVPRAIAELKRIGERRIGQTESDRVRPSQTEPDRQSEPSAPKNPINTSNEATQTNPDPVRLSQTESDRVRPSQTEPDFDITQHPLVKHLQKDVDHWRDEYKAQVKVTQVIQTQAFEKIVELQRLVQVGQSSILADFFLKAKNWALGAPDEEGDDDRADDATPPSRTKKRKERSDDAQNHDA